MLILHIIPSLDARDGSPADQLFAMVKAQSTVGIEAAVVTTPAEDRLAARFWEVGAALEFFELNRLPLGTAPDLITVLGNNIADADAVHLHGFYDECHFEAARIAAMQGVPFVVSAHGTLGPERMFQSGRLGRFFRARRMKKLLDKADCLHFDDEMERDLTLGMNIETMSIVEPISVRRDGLQAIPDLQDFARRWQHHYERIVARRLEMRKAKLRGLRP